MLPRRIVFALITTTLLTACATIVDGPKQSVTVDSNPKGAKIFIASKVRKNGKTEIINRVEAGVTPAAVSISRKDGVIILEKEGYEATEVPLKRGINPWIWGDVVMTSLLSTSIDTSTGAANEYDPGEYLVEMKAKP
jgi:hypothetical protein